MDKKNILTYQGLQKLEDELQNLKVVRRKEVAQKNKEARSRETYLRTLSMMQQKMSSVISKQESNRSRKS